MNKVIAITLTAAALATMAGAAQKSKVKKVIKPKAPKVVILPECKPMVGLWTLRDGEKPRLDIKMKFTPDGHFAFLGPNWKSTGNYRIVENKLSLEWSTVDGQPIKPGVMKKDFALDATTTSFVIDKYTYYKFGAPIVSVPVAAPETAKSDK